MALNAVCMQKKIISRIFKISGTLIQLIQFGVKQVLAPSKPLKNADYLFCRHKK
jgi:hypothetical protein